jgi:hypothetical protein
VANVSVADRAGRITVQQRNDALERPSQSPWIAVIPPLIEGTTEVARDAIVADFLGYYITTGSDRLLIRRNTLGLEFAEVFTRNVTFRRSATRGFWGFESRPPR